MPELQRTLITKEGLEKLEKELDELRTKTRAEVAQRLKEAIQWATFRKTPNMMMRKTSSLL